MERDYSSFSLSGILTQCLGDCPKRVWGWESDICLSLLRAQKTALLSEGDKGVSGDKSGVSSWSLGSKNSSASFRQIFPACPSGEGRVGRKIPESQG